MLKPELGLIICDGKKKTSGKVYVCVYPLHLSSFIFSVSVSVSACVRMKCVDATGDRITPDKAIDRGIKVTIEYLQRTALIHSAP